MSSIEERTLTIVPARGGSKGIPRKNIKLLGGHPLLAYTLASARAAGLSRVVLSTEDEEIASVAEGLGFEVPFLRPRDLAQDDTPTLPVLLHVLERLAENEDLERYDYICLLQPTSPLRSPETIRRCLERMEISAKTAKADTLRVDSVMTVLPVPHEYNPHWVYRRGHNGALDLFTGEQQPIPRRQDLPPAVHREGSVYLVRRTVLESRESLYGERTVGVEVDREASVNLDTASDWQRAEELIAACPELVSFLPTLDGPVDHS